MSLNILQNYKEFLRLWTARQRTEVIYGEVGIGPQHFNLWASFEGGEFRMYLDLGIFFDKVGSALNCAGSNWAIYILGKQVVCIGHGNGKIVRPSFPMLFLETFLRIREIF